MARNKSKRTRAENLNAEQLRIAADPNANQQHAQPNQHSATHASPSSRVTWHAATTISNLQEATDISRVRTETKASFDALKAQGLSSNKIMSELLRGKTGGQFHAAKMVVQAEKCKERAKELKMLFPEIRGVPGSISQAEWNRSLSAQGHGE